MRYQSTASSCGAAAVVNVLRVFGRRVAEPRVRRLAGTNADGTGAAGIVAALRGLGLTAAEFSGDKPGIAWSWLHGSLVHGRCVIMSVDDDSHWVAAIGAVGSRVVVVDSTNVLANVRENGVHVLSRPRLLARWRAGGKAYYGVSAGKN